jgi:hydroxymethylglutaryl-CoA synthase
MSSHLLAGAVALPADRVPIRAGRRCAAHYDHDAVTLAAEAVLALPREGLPAPAALLFASVSPPYDEGGSAQLIAEIAGLGDDLFCAELTATPRDGLAALRIADALVAVDGGPVLVCAAHVRRSDAEREAGDGAVALLVGERGGLATLTPGPSHSEELRDRWRLAGEKSVREADASFTEELGPSRIARLVADAARERIPEPAALGGASPARSVDVLIAGPSSRSAGRVERALGGPGDTAAARTGVLGAAHPLLRLLLSLHGPAMLVAASGGLGDACLVEPTEDAAELAAAIEAEVAGGREVPSIPPPPAQTGFDPYVSGPRAWRERGQDLRLEGVVRDGRVQYPPPAGIEGERRPLSRTGSVLTCTRDHVYPGADTLQMAVVALDDGSRFYGQVTAGEEVEIGQDVRLVPRRLHDGGGLVQYFWKVSPCR